jgi:hypothetical protein
MTINRIAYAFVLIITLTLTGTPTRASVTIDIFQSGTSVVASGGGTLDLSGLTFIPSSFIDSGQMQPRLAIIVEGPPSDLTLFSGYQSIAGPTTFGTGFDTFATTGSGDIFGIESNNSDYYLFVPTGYVSGQSLSATDTYSNASLSSLGLTPGTYTWNWGTGAHADSFTLQIETAAAVPEPSTAINAVFGAVAFIAYAWSRHRRDQR